jgi:hypothetical protein
MTSKDVKLLKYKFILFSNFTPLDDDSILSMNDFK